MADLRYDFLDNNFTTYESVETPKVEEISLPLGNQKLSVDSFIGFSNGLSIIISLASLVDRYFSGVNQF